MTRDPRPLRVEFVCTGNICRSPVAAAIFRARLEQAGLDGEVEVASSGIGSWHAGEPMDRRSAATLRAHGYDDAHVARQVDDDTRGADLLLAATADHVRDLRAGGVESDRVRLLRSFDPEAPEGAEVPDPYYGGPDGFDDVVAMVEAAMPGLVEWARARV